MVPVGPGGAVGTPAHPSPARVPPRACWAAALSPPAEQGFSAGRLLTGHQDTEAPGSAGPCRSCPRPEWGTEPQPWAGCGRGGEGAVGPCFYPSVQRLAHFPTKAFDTHQGAPLAGPWAEHSTPVRQVLRPHQGVQGRLPLQATLLPAGASTPPWTRPRKPLVEAVLSAEPSPARPRETDFTREVTCVLKGPYVSPTTGPLEAAPGSGLESHRARVMPSCSSFPA